MGIYHAWAEYPSGLSFHFLGSSRRKVFSRARSGLGEEPSIEKVEDEIEFLSNRPWLEFEGLVKLLKDLQSGRVISFTEVE